MENSWLSVHGRSEGSSTNGTNGTIVWGSQPVGSPLLLFFIQAIVIMVMCRTLAFILAKIKQPSVIAEVVSGIILGPSLFGNIPGYSATLFPAASIAVLNVIANVGLVFFMFLIGLELDFGLLRKNLKTTIFISASGIISPMATSIGVSYLIYNTLGAPSEFGPFLLFMGVAMSITAFPVLARIIKEKNLFKARVGTITLSTAAWDDVAAWCLLALALSVATGSNWLNALYTIIALFAFVILMWFGGTRLLKLIFERTGVILPNETAHVNPTVFCAIICMVLLTAWITEYIGLHAIFGAFVFGICMPREGHIHVVVTEKLEDLVLTFFLPLYFTFSGLRTNIALLDDGRAWGLTVLVVAVAILSKFLGGSLVARCVGMGWRESFTLGVLMNTKGLVELIVLNVGLDHNIISPQVFTMMVLMALVTTFITGPVVHWLYPLKRIIEFEAQTSGKQSLMVTVRDPKSLTPFQILLDSLTRAKPDKFQLYGVRIVQLQDRPSAYMKSGHDDKALEDLARNMELLGIHMKQKPLTYDGNQESKLLQLAALAKSKNAHFVFLHWQQPMTGARVGGTTSHGLVSMIDTNLVTLIDRGMVRAIQKVSFVYTGTVHDVEACKLVKAMAEVPGVSVHVFHPVKPGRNDKEPSILTRLRKIRPQLITIEILEANADINSKIAKSVIDQNSDLLIVGSDDVMWTNEDPVLHLKYADIVGPVSCSALVVRKCETGDGAVVAKMQKIEKARLKKAKEMVPLTPNMKEKHLKEVAASNDSEKGNPHEEIHVDLSADHSGK